MKTLISIILSLLIFSSSALSQTSFRTNLKNSPSDMVNQAKSLYSEDFYPYLVLGGVAFGIAWTLDDEVQDYFLKNEPLGNGRADLGNDYLGDAKTLGISSLSVIGLGLVAKDSKIVDTGFATTEALILEATIISGLKYITKRERPDGSSDSSFPSGHVGGITTFTMTIANMYDATWQQKAFLSLIPAYVGASRIQANKHHFSDVVVGYVIGLYISDKVAEYWKDKESKWTPVPIVEDGIYGVGFSCNI